MRSWVIITGKGEAYTTVAHSAPQALTKFRRRYPGLEVSSIVETIDF